MFGLLEIMFTLLFLSFTKVTLPGEVGTNWFFRTSTCKQIFLFQRNLQTQVRSGNFDHRNFSFVFAFFDFVRTPFLLLSIKSLLVLLFEIVKRGTEQELGYKRTVGRKSFRAKKYRAGRGRGQARNYSIEIYIAIDVLGGFLEQLET